jgi:hypothetical protein
VSNKITSQFQNALFCPISASPLSGICQQAQILTPGLQSINKELCSKKDAQGVKYDSCPIRLACVLLIFHGSLMGCKIKARAFFTPDKTGH